MKKIISFIVALCLAMSLCAALVSCDNGKSSDSTSNDDKTSSNNTTTAITTTATTTTVPADEVKSNILLPEKFTLSGITASDMEIPLTWTENSCTFVIEDTTYLFEYDKASKSLRLEGTSSNGVFADTKDFCKFDENGRVTSVSYDGMVIISFSYEGNKMSVLSCTSSDASFPISLSPDFNNNTVIAPPFENADSLAHFNEHGDLIGITDEEYYDLFNYEYDKSGNITSVSVPLATATITYTYGDSEADDIWQKYVIKFLNTATVSGLQTFVTDIMCENLPR